MFNKLFILNNQSNSLKSAKFADTCYDILYMFASMQSKLYHGVNSYQKSFACLLVHIYIMTKV